MAQEDPASMNREVEQIQELVKSTVPTFGIVLDTSCWPCFWAKTSQTCLRHRGGNQPVKDLQVAEWKITSHNHGFAVLDDSLPAEVEITHVNLNDRCVEGMRT